MNFPLVYLFEFVNILIFSKNVYVIYLQRKQKLYTMSGLIIYIVVVICLAFIGFSFVNGIVCYNRRLTAKTYIVLISTLWFPLLVVAVIWLFWCGLENISKDNNRKNSNDGSMDLKKKFFEVFK